MRDETSFRYLAHPTQIELADDILITSILGKFEHADANAARFLIEPKSLFSNFAGSCNDGTPTVMKPTREENHLIAHLQKEKSQSKVYKPNAIRMKITEEIFSSHSIE